MRFDKAYCQRDFAKVTVRITYEGKISVSGPTYRILGKITPAGIWWEEPVKSKLILKWIKDRIQAGKFDHLKENNNV